MGKQDSPILVTGAGVTGGEVLRQLRQAEIAARTMVRDPEKAEPFAKLGVEIFEGDFAEAKSWDGALSGVEKVFAITSSHPQAQAWFGLLLQAAKKAGVHHVVKLSGWRVSPTSEAKVHREMAGSDEVLRQSGLGHTILRPNVFFQNMLMMAGPIRTESRFRSAARDARISMIDVRDIAAVAVKVLSGGDHFGKIYDMSGPETLTYFDVARFLSQALGREVTYEPLDVETAVRNQIAAGIPEEVARGRVGIHASFASGVFAPTSDLVQTVLGHPPRSFARFAADYLETFR